MFWRIFFSFWVSITLFAGFMGGFSDHLARQHRMERIQELFQSGQRIADQIPHLDRQGIQDMLRQRDRRNSSMIFVVDGQGTEALERKRELRRALSRSGKGRVADFTAVDATGIEYRVYVVPKHRHLLVSGSRSGTFTRILIAALLSALASYVLARSLVRPLAHLRATTRKIAAGDLGARNAPVLVSRRDEIGQLAADLDHMAGRLEQLDQARTRLLTDVSHELRSPLARLKVALELAREKLPADIDAELNRMSLEASRLGELIDQVLELLRESTASLPMEIISQDINTLVEQVVEQANYEPHARGETGIEFIIGQPLYCEIDTELVSRALDNVLRNALRYTDPSKGVMVTTGKPGKNVQIMVRDFGPGIPPDHLDRLFDPFYRVSESRDRDSGGHGLGLAIAAAAIARHEGEIRAENHPHSGLVIIIELPGTV